MSVGDRMAVLVVAVTVDVPVGPAANWPGVAVMAAVAGVASALLLMLLQPLPSSWWLRSRPFLSSRQLSMRRLRLS